MTSFVHVEQPADHPGVVRAEAAMARLRAARRGLDGSRGLAALLLAAIASAMLVVADRLMSNWTDGGLLLAWAVLWAVGFFAIGLFASSSRSLAARVVIAGRAAARRRASARADEQFLAYAKYDTRILRELQAAATRHESSEAKPTAASKALSAAIVEMRATEGYIPTLYEAMRRVNLGKFY